MTLTGRWTNYEEKQGYWGPLAQQEATIVTYKARIEATKVTSISGDWAFRVNSDNARTQQQLSSVILQLSGIRSRVLGLLHAFVTGVYYERQFADVAERTLEGYKREVDA